MAWDDRLLFTGSTKKEAEQKAIKTLSDIEAKLSEWKCRQIKFCNVEEIKPTVIDNVTYYYSLVAPLNYWNGIGKCDFSKISYDKKEKYNKSWKKENIEIDIFR